ncbi:MAG: P1 family peptidase [Acidobacteriota bacterium]|jgi:D-aminopeptidase
MPLNRRNLLQISPLALVGLTAGCHGQAPIVGRHRARALGVRIGTMPPGRFNAITDVNGVTVGHTTLIEGDGELVVGGGPVRTGVTAIWPHADILDEYLPCGTDAPNGNGEATGLIQAARLGVLGSPICLTNTSSVGMVYDALLERLPAGDTPTVEPVVAETWDAFLNDVEGRHVHAEHVYAALDAARSGPVEEGCVGGGTGMICYGFKGGIGTASRRLPPPLDAHTVGVLVQANHGARALLRIDGVPVGEAIDDLQPQSGDAGAMNSIIMVVATDAPLLDYQLDRLARRAVHGLAKTGSISSNSSGDFTIAFSTANRIPREDFWRGDTYSQRSIDQLDIEPLLRATAESTEEAVVNALFMATDMVGRDGNRVWALPLDRTLELLAAHGRLFAPPGDAAGD